jgi:uncharacterized phage protein (predicted DNA packaging)
MIDLQDVKDHLRIDHDAEDVGLMLMLDAAEQHIACHLEIEGGTLDPLQDDQGHLPAPIHVAVLMLVGDLYLNREGQSDRRLFENGAFCRLLNPYRQAVV